MRSALVLVDGTQAAARAVKHAGELALADGGRLTLLYVIRPTRSAGAGPYIVCIPEESERFASKVLHRMSKAAPEGVPVHTIVRRGMLVEEIIRRAGAADHDLIVIASSSWRRPLGGRCLSCAVRRRSGLPVIKIRSSGQDERCCLRVRASVRARAAIARGLARWRGEMLWSDSP